MHSNDFSVDVPSFEVILGKPVVTDIEVTPAGQVNVYNELAEQIKANKNEEVFFAVKVVLCGVIDDIIEEQKKLHDAYMDALNEPIVQEYRAQYDEWSRIPIEKLDSYSAQFRMTEESMPDSFYAYWVSTHTKEEKAAYDTAWALVEEKYVAFSSTYEDLLPEASAERTFEEVKRLQGKGLLLMWSKGTEMVGFLTGEQIMRFPADERYGFYITWADIPENDVLASSE